ncbi:HAMP domain-containing sensor histidine kinase [Sphingomonas sp.]|uniref:sensor histidine kinase n=1 Tax=Sphingomonas sp. TaxID=28214 RepID=UPI003B000881
MRARRPVSISAQTIAFFLVGLVVAQLVSIALVLLLPPPRPDFATMTEIAEALLGAPPVDSSLSTKVRSAPPAAGDGMVSQAMLTDRLARIIGRDPADVRLAYEADQSETFPYPRRSGRRAVPIRHGQPYFFNTVEAAVRLPGGGWRIARTSPRPLLTAWQQRTIISFALSVLAVLPFALIFARALTRPIRRFAHAVERLDHDHGAPEVTPEGPAELRLTAHALNAMRRNLHANLRERSAMIGAIAHDLRTPLARIAFRIERAPPAIRDPVLADIEQMREMVAATIGFVRDGAGVRERKPVDLGALAARLVAQARDTGSAVSAGTLEPVTVAGDRSAMERLIQNLLDNAVAYAGGGELAVVRVGKGARLTVADSGPGIAEQALEAMFEPFAREPSRGRATGGVGLGLAIARSVAQAHGGTITATNREGGGLIVAVTLPTG